MVDAVAMATKRLSKYEKALNRLERVTVSALVSRGNDAKGAMKMHSALEEVLISHWEVHGDDCEWCLRFPPLFP